jgi:hypothetical protein
MDWTINVMVILLLGPGIWALRKSRPGRMVILCVAWYALFYATVFYLSRFRISVWPVFVMAGAGGLAKAGEVFNEGSRPGRIILILCFGICLIAFSLVSNPISSPLARARAWRQIRVGEGLSEGHKRGVLIIIADEMAKARRLDLINKDLGRFIEARRGSLSPEALTEVGDHFSKDLKLSVAAFFYRMADELAGGDGKARKRLASIDRLRRTVNLASWEEAGRDQAAGMAVYTARLPGPVLADPKTPPLKMRLMGAGREYTYNAGMFEDRGVAGFQYAFRDSRVYITLPSGADPPSGQRPLTLDYFTPPSPVEGFKKSDGSGALDLKLAEPDKLNNNKDWK